MHKKILRTMLAACLFFTAGMTVSHAEEADDQVTEETILTETTAESTQMSADEDLLSASFYYVNPYAPVQSNPEAFHSSEITEEELPTIEVDNVDDLVPEYRNFLVQRTGKFNVVIYGETESDDIQGFLDEIDEDVSRVMREDAYAHTGVPYEGDYLKFQCGASGYNLTDYDIQYVEGVYKCAFTFTFTVDYYTTADQEQAVTERLGEVLDELDLAGKSDYEKVKAVHDYIASHTEYDYEHLGDESYKLQYTAYGALINGTSVCQGYANLFYRMCLEAGVDNRIVSGQGEGNNGWEAHAWNIVKLDNLYYHLDATWDSPYDPGNERFYGYFLKGQNSFAENHAVEDAYLNNDFVERYPISADDYVRTYWDDYPDDEPSFTGASLLLSGEIGVNFYMKLPAYDGADYQDSYMEFIINDMDMDSIFVYIDEDARSADGRLYRFTCYVNSLQMADPISAVYHYYSDGTEETAEAEYTVQEYISQLVDNEEFDFETQELAKALADYGHYVQKYMSELKGWTIGVDHAEMDLYYLDDLSVYAGEYASSFTDDLIAEQSDLISNLAVSLVLDSATSINVYFEVPKNFNGEIRAFNQNDNTECEIVKVGGSKYMAVVPNIAAHLLNTKQPVTIELDTGDDISATRLNIAATDYAKLCLRKETIAENEQNALTALCRYADSADNYKETHQ